MKKYLLLFALLTCSVQSFAQIPTPGGFVRPLLGNYNFIYSDSTGADTIKIYPNHGIAVDTLYFGDVTTQSTAWQPGISDTNFVNAQGDSLYGTFYFPNHGNSYLRGNNLYFVNSPDYLQATPTQIKVSAGTQDYSDLRSYGLRLNKAASQSIQVDTNGVLMYATDYAVRDEQGFEYLRHNYGDSSTTIGNIIISNAVADMAVVVNGDISASKIHVSQSLQIGNDTTTASAANVGAIRYRSDANNSYCEMVMQTGASTYAWVIIKQNTW